eukprot:12402394-Karenia_brevis.AAC.1
MLQKPKCPNIASEFPNFTLCGSNLTLSWQHHGPINLPMASTTSNVNKLPDTPIWSQDAYFLAEAGLSQIRGVRHL